VSGGARGGVVTGDKFTAGINDTAEQ